MKKIILFVLLFVFSLSLYASNLIEAGDEYIAYVTSVSKSDMNKGSFANLKSKGKDNGIIMKYTKDLSQCTTSIFGAEESVYFYNVVCDKNGDFIVVGVAEESAIGKGDLKNVKSFGGADVILVRYDKNLKLKDVQTFGSAGDDFCSYVTINEKGKILIAGDSVFDDGVTKAFVSMLDDEFKVEIATDFRGSFVSKEDAKVTKFNKVIECKDGSYAIIGYAIDNKDKQKSLILKTNYKLVIYDKKSFGNKDGNMFFSDIIEKPEGGFVIVGYSEDKVQKGYVLNLTEGLNKIVALNYLPTFKNKKSSSNYIRTVEPFKDYEGYLITGVCMFDEESMDYYTIYYPETEIFELVPFDERGGLNHLICNDTSFYIIGYKDDRLVPEEIGWF